MTITRDAANVSIVAMSRIMIFVLSKILAWSDLSQIIKIFRNNNIV